MLKQIVKYTDFNDDEVEEEVFFNLTQAEIVELEMSVDGGWSEMITKVQKAAEANSGNPIEENGRIIMQELKKMILLSYGHKSPDGKRFIKNQQLRDEFESSEAYSVVFMDLCTNAEAAANFINGVMPKALRDEVAKMTDEDKARLVNVKAVPDPTPKTVTRRELAEMNQADFQAVQAQIASGEVTLAE